MRSREHARLALLVLFGAVSCHRGAGQRSARAVSASATTAGDPVVATLDGAPVLASEVAAELRRGGGTPSEALERVLRFEALVTEARRRGLDRDPDVEMTASQAAVRALLDRRFVPSFHERDIPEEDVERAYARGGPTFQHPELADVVYYVLLVPQGGSVADEARALAAAYALRAMAAGVRSDAEFRALGDALARGNPALARHMTVQELATAQDGGTQKPFADAAFALAQPGAVDGPVRTSFGWHVLRLVRRVPPLATPLAEVDPELRRAIFPAEQRAAFARFYETIAARHRIEWHLERLPAPAFAGPAAPASAPAESASP